MLAYDPERKLAPGFLYVRIWMAWFLLLVNGVPLLVFGWAINQGFDPAEPWISGLAVLACTAYAMKAGAWLAESTQAPAQFVSYVIAFRGRPPVDLAGPSLFRPTGASQGRVLRMTKMFLWGVAAVSAFIFLVEVWRPW